MGEILELVRTFQPFDPIFFHYLPLRDLRLEFQDLLSSYRRCVPPACHTLHLDQIFHFRPPFLSFTSNINVLVADFATAIIGELALVVVLCEPLRGSCTPKLAGPLFFPSSNIHPADPLFIERGFLQPPNLPEVDRYYQRQKGKGRRNPPGVYCRLSPKRS